MIMMRDVHRSDEKLPGRALVESRNQPQRRIRKSKGRGTIKPEKSQSDAYACSSKSRSHPRFPRRSSATRSWCCDGKNKAYHPVAPSRELLRSDRLRRSEGQVRDSKSTTHCASHGRLLNTLQQTAIFQKGAVPQEAQ